MKKTIILLFTVAGGLFVQTASPERHDQDTRQRHAAVKKACSKQNSEKEDLS